MVTSRTGLEIWFEYQPVHEPTYLVAIPCMGQSILPIRNQMVLGTDTLPSLYRVPFASLETEACCGLSDKFGKDHWYSS